MKKNVCFLKNSVLKITSSMYAPQKVGRSFFRYVIFFTMIGCQSVSVFSATGDRVLRGPLAERLQWLLLSEGVTEKAKIGELKRLYDEGYTLSYFYTENVKEVPLSLAVFDVVFNNKKQSVLEFLLDCRVSVDERDRSGTSPLDYAACFGNSSILSLLIGAGAQKDCNDQSGSSPLFKYIEAGHGKPEDLLQLSNGAIDLFAIHLGKRRSCKRYATALSLACFLGNRSAVESLLKMGASTETVCIEVYNGTIHKFSASKSVIKGKNFLKKRASSGNFYKNKMVEYEKILILLRDIKKSREIKKRIAQLRIVVPHCSSSD